MKSAAPIGLAASLTLVAAMTHAAELTDYVNERISEFEAIPAVRRAQLGELTKYIRTQRDEGRPIRLTFICTHNSRRSQMAQVWAAIAADHYDVEEVMTYSGGTEATAFNPRAVAALERAGVKVTRRSTALAGENPTYAVQIGEQRQECFSKVYNEKPNPAADFAGVMTCSQADKNCPNVAGAEARIALPYDDPKAADGTDAEAGAYDERCAQIAREMLYVFSQL